MMLAECERVGGLDILVNNAGIGYFGKTVEELGEEFRQTIETNLYGVFYACHYAIPMPRTAAAVISSTSLRLPGRMLIRGWRLITRRNLASMASAKL